MSAIASAAQSHSPLLVLGGRAPQFRWGQGSLQELDHVPFVRPLVKYAVTPESTAEIPPLLDEAIRAALTPHSGPAFIDFPLDYVFGEAVDAAAPAPLPEPWRGRGADQREVSRAAALLREAERPVVMAGAGLYWGRGEDALSALADRLRLPVFVNGLARGCLPADHDLCFSRARGAGLGGADVALLIGAPLDFRLGFGGAFAPECTIIAIDSAEPDRDYPRPVAAELYGALPATLDALRDACAVSAREEWLTSLRAIEEEKRAAEASELRDDRAPLHPMRVYGDLMQLLDRDAIIVGDGGDFVSFAGRVVDSFVPGSWLDPGRFGCLGSGPGYALAAKLAHPDRQVVLLLGDGAFGFSAMEFDTFARHGVAVVAVVGNNGIWALEKHPMESIYGYAVAADLRPETRYDTVVEALGCHGELVRTPAELRPALERAFECGSPTLVNVLTDPSVAYPRRSVLA
jgi:acetolactate synthase-1/2/3 large subunit